jgi:hypothetical protein
MREPKLTRSEFEDEFLAQIRQAGLPEPLSNYVLDAPDHGRGEPDFYWPAHGLVVETDGSDVDPATVLRRVASLLAP